MINVVINHTILSQHKIVKKFVLFGLFNFVNDQVSIKNAIACTK